MLQILWCCMFWLQDQDWWEFHFLSQKLLCFRLKDHDEEFQHSQKIQALGKISCKASMLTSNYISLIASVNSWIISNREDAFWIVFPESSVITRQRTWLWIRIFELLDWRLEQNLFVDDDVIWVEFDDRFLDRLRLWVRPVAAFPRDSETSISGWIKNFCLNVVQSHVFINSLHTFSMISSFFPSIWIVSWW